MVSICQLEMGIARYLDAELIPKLPTDGAKGFGIQVMTTLATKRVGALVSTYASNPIIKAMGITDDAGNVDIDALREAVLKSMPDTGLAVDVPLAGKLTFYKTDVDKLYQLICG